MKGIAQIVFYSCRKAVDLIEAKQQGQLSTTERFRLNLHLKMCDKCQSWEQKSVKMNDTLNTYFEKGKKSAEHADFSDLKKRIQEKIKNR